MTDATRQLRLMKARTDSVILPYASRNPTDPDPGVAVYWPARDGSSMAIACDEGREHFEA